MVFVQWYFSYINISNKNFRIKISINGVLKYVCKQCGSYLREGIDVSLAL